MAAIEILSFFSILKTPIIKIVLQQSKYSISRKTCQLFINLLCLKKKQSCTKEKDLTYDHYYSKQFKQKLRCGIHIGGNQFHNRQRRQGRSHRQKRLRQEHTLQNDFRPSSSRQRNSFHTQRNEPGLLGTDTEF